MRARSWCCCCFCCSFGVSCELRGFPYQRRRRPFVCERCWSVCRCRNRRALSFRKWSPIVACATWASHVSTIWALAIWVKRPKRKGVRMCGATTFGECAHVDVERIVSPLSRSNCLCNICRLVSIRVACLWFYFFTAANKMRYKMRRIYVCAFCSIVKSCWFTHSESAKDDAKLVTTIHTRAHESSGC